MDREGGGPGGDLTSVVGPGSDSTADAGRGIADRASRSWAAARETAARWWSVQAIRAGARCAWVAGIAVVLLPPPFLLPGGVLDSSWILGLVLAHRSGLHFGTDVVWTYGPLGYLNFPEYFYFREWLEQLIAAVTVHVLLIALVAVLLARARASFWKWAAVTVALLMPSSVLTSFAFELIFCVVLLLHLAVTDEHRWISFGAAVLGGGLAGTSALVKETDLVTGFVTVVIAAILCWTGARRVHAGALFGGYALSLASLWFIAGQGLGNVGPYLRGVLEIAGGYSAALGLNGSDGATLTAVVLGLLVVAAAVLAWMENNRRLLSLSGLFIPVTYVTFRDDFVRAGDRKYDFFSLLVLAFALMVVEARPRSDSDVGAAPRRSAAAIALALTACVALTAQGNVRFPFSTLTERGHEVSTSLGLVRDSAAAHAKTDQVRALLAAQYGVDDAVLSLARSGTLDVFPSDIDVVFAYGLPWEPRPVLAAYSSVSSYLDGIDAAHVQQPGRPDHVLYTYGSIDDRYAMFDEPQTLRALLEKYVVQIRTTKTSGVGAFLLLSPRAAPLSDEGRDEGSVCAPLGQPISVPNVPGRLVYANVSMPYSLWGRLENLAYKPGDADVSFDLGSAGWTPPLRFLPATAGAGVLVSAFVSNSTEAADLFVGSIDHQVRSVAFDSPNRSDYSGQVCVSFVSRPSA